MLGLQLCYTVYHSIHCLILLLSSELFPLPFILVRGPAWGSTDAFPVPPVAHPPTVSLPAPANTTRRAALVTTIMMVEAGVVMGTMVTTVEVMMATSIMTHSSQSTLPALQW